MYIVKMIKELITLKSEKATAISIDAAASYLLAAAQKNALGAKKK